MFKFMIGMLLLALALSASASAGPFYVSTGFGANWDEDPPFAFINEDTGLVGTLALGTRVNGVDGLRFELEASFRTHDSTIGPIVLEHDTTAVMANAVYDVNGLAMGRVVPFLLLGAGVAHTELTVGGLSLLTLENDGFAYQAGFGANYAITDSMALGVGYRYLQAPEIAIFGVELDGGGNHSVMATATIALN